MAGTTRLELATSAVTGNLLISNGVGGHLLIPQDTICHLLSSPYCPQIWTIQIQADVQDPALAIDVTHLNETY